MKKSLAILVLLSALGCTDQLPKPAGNQATEAELTLRQNMRKLWTDNAVWTRSFIVASIAGTPDADAAVARLLRNQADIGSAIAAYFGAETGQQLTELLKQRVTIAVDLSSAAKANDAEKYSAISAQWQENGRAIADLLAKDNPNWSQATLREMMDKHLTTTEAVAKARLSEDWSGDVTAYDVAYDHTLAIADALSVGIMRQFPDKF